LGSLVIEKEYQVFVVPHKIPDKNREKGGYIVIKSGKIIF